MATNGNSSVREPFDSGRTESDATHFRLRNDIHSSQYITCLSCAKKFACTSILQIYEHYSEQDHLHSYGSCLYCKGKVHQFYRIKNNCTEIYHNCSRWKRGEDR